MKQGYAFQKNMHDLKLVRHNSKGEGYFLFKEPVGSKLSKQQRKEILKREKKKYKWIKSDEVEDPYGRNTKADHYQIAEHQARIEYQKYQLCKGKSFRVSF